MCGKVLDAKAIFLSLATLMTLNFSSLVFADGSALGFGTFYNPDHPDSISAEASIRLPLFLGFNVGGAYGLSGEWSVLKSNTRQQDYTRCFVIFSPSWSWFTFYTGAGFGSYKGELDRAFGDEKVFGYEDQQKIMKEAYSFTAPDFFGGLELAFGRNLVAHGGVRYIMRSKTDKREPGRLSYELGLRLRRESQKAKIEGQDKPWERIKKELDKLREPGATSPIGEIERLEREYIECLGKNCRYEELEEILRQKMEELDKLKKRKSDVPGEIEKAKKKLESAMEELHRARNFERSARGKKDENSEFYKKQKDRLEKAETEYKKAEEKLEKLEKEQQELEGEIEKREKLIEDLKEKIAVCKCKREIKYGEEKPYPKVYIIPLIDSTVEIKIAGEEVEALGGGYEKAAEYGQRAAENLADYFRALIGAKETAEKIEKWSERLGAGIKIMPGGIVSIPIGVFAQELQFASDVLDALKGLPETMDTWVVCELVAVMKVQKITIYYRDKFECGKKHIGIDCTRIVKQTVEVKIEQGGLTLGSIRDPEVLNSAMKELIRKIQNALLNYEYQKNQMDEFIESDC